MVTAATALALLSGPLAGPTEGREVLELVCLECHDGASAEAKFDVGALLERDVLAESLFDWRRVRAVVESGAMPPPSQSGDDAGGSDANGLDADEVRDVLAFLDTAERDAYERGGAAGHEPIRRLTRGELGRALRDLVGVDVDIESLMPDELVAENGFEANSSTLFVHSQWLERADVAVRVALRAALPDEGPASAPFRGEAAFDAEAFLRRAYRRPPTPDEVESLRTAVAEREGAAPRAALRAALFEARASPHFRMRLEDARAVEPDERPDGRPDGRPGERAVGAYGLASRLSFLLWSAAPDDALLDLAAAGALEQPEILDAQVERMLADPRALDFTRGFAGQWLGTRRLGREFKPDPIDVPFMTDSLMASMRDEVARFVLYLFAEDRPLADLLTSETTFVDGELARFYRMKGIRGSDAAAVRVRDPRRRGLLGKAGVLASTSYPDRTSPVLRGAWILDDLLGTPPPPPPPGASDLDDEVLERAEERGPRAILELHRASASCASCHDRIDPLGFALEGFDQYGRTRRHYEDGGRVDTGGALPGGETFRGPSALSRVLVEARSEELSREVSRRLLAYALGRPLDWRDERTVIDLAETLRARGFGALLRALVSSRPFRFVEVS
ncbi:MAG: DUF1592 domain-containing protein [Planctomycetota bacterium]